MTQNIPLAKGDVAIEPFFDAIQELLSGAAPNFAIKIDESNPALLRVVGSATEQSSISVAGRYRFRTTDATATVAGAAGTYNIYVTASDNAFTGPPEDLDQPTDYTFGLTARSIGSGVPVGVDLYRLVGTCYFNGTQIAGLRQTVGHGSAILPTHAWATSAYQTPLTARGASGQSADTFRIENSSGSKVLGFNEATGLDVDGPVTADGALTAAAGIYLTANVILDTSTGSKIGSAANQKLGFLGATPVIQQANTTDIKDLLQTFGLMAAGTGASPLNLDGGTLTAGTVNATSAIQRSGVALAASHLSNGVTGSGAVVLAASPTVTGTLSAAAGSFSGALSAAGLDSSALVTSAAGFTSDGSTGGFGISAANSAGNTFLSARQSGDSNHRFSSTVSGILNWGPGNAVADVNLYRNGANTLQTDDTFVANTLVATGGALIGGALAVGGDISGSLARTTLSNDGSGSDTSISTTATPDDTFATFTAAAAGVYFIVGAGNLYWTGNTTDNMTYWARLYVDGSPIGVEFEDTRRGVGAKAYHPFTLCELVVLGVGQDVDIRVRANTLQVGYDTNDIVIKAYKLSN